MPGLGREQGNIFCGDFIAVLLGLYSFIVTSE